MHPVVCLRPLDCSDNCQTPGGWQTSEAATSSPTRIQSCQPWVRPPPLSTYPFPQPEDHQLAPELLLLLLLLLLPCLRHLDRGGHQVPGSSSVPGSRFQVPGSRFQSCHFQSNQVPVLPTSSQLSQEELGQATLKTSAPAVQCSHYPSPAGPVFIYEQWRVRYHQPQRVRVTQFHRAEQQNATPEPGTLPPTPEE